MRVVRYRRSSEACLPSGSEGGRCMYLLTVKDGLGTRHIGPYPTPKHASDDLDRILESCSDRARWQIHALEVPERVGRSLHAMAS